MTRCRTQAVVLISTNKGIGLGGGPGVLAFGSTNWVSNRLLLLDYGSPLHVPVLICIGRLADLHLSAVWQQGGFKQAPKLCVVDSHSDLGADGAVGQMTLQI